MRTFYGLLSITCLVLLISCSTSTTELYVSVSGSDSGPGTREMPFKTIEKAQSKVRELTSSGTAKNITVIIGKGTYRLDKPLVMDQSDSYPEGFTVRFRGAADGDVMISGGYEIKGWEKSDNSLWAAHLNLRDAGIDEFRELFIDGQRAARARHPDSGFLRVASAGADRRTNFSYTKGDFPIPDDPREVELIMLHDWSITRIGLSGIDTLKRIITASDTVGAKGIDFFKIDNWEKHPRYFLENSLCFLDSDNEWYYDNKKSILFLRLSSNSSPDDRKIVIPVVGENLLCLNGSMTKKIRNIHFENITFSYCSWNLQGGRYAGIQACFYDSPGDTAVWSSVPAAVEARWTENCSFDGCSFLHLGGSGLRFGTGSVNCTINNCRFEDISGNGVMIGEGRDRKVDGSLWWEKVPDQVAYGNKIGSSVITACGRQFYGAVGIWYGLTAQTAILNNHVYDLPYTGISAGWMWSPVPTPCRENRIEGNHIHNVMQILSDGGGIYMLGLQKGSRIIRNHIHDIPLNAGRAESNGMFLDEGTADVEISNNLVYKIAKSPLRFHKAQVNNVRDNILSCSDDNPPVRYNNTPTGNIVMDNNQILHENNPEDLKILDAAVRNRNR
jgi:hypothetical protein